MIYLIKKNSLTDGGEEEKGFFIVHVEGYSFATMISGRF